jgi:hypothetical protein
MTDTQTEVTEPLVRAIISTARLTLERYAAPEWALLEERVIVALADRLATAEGLLREAVSHTEQCVTEGARYCTVHGESDCWIARADAFVTATLPTEE